MLADRFPFPKALGAGGWPKSLARRFSLAERVMRARNPIWKRDSISAGRTSERSQSTGLGKKGVYPLVGSQRRYTPKKRIERIAIQNAGAETPISARVITNESTQVCR